MTIDEAIAHAREVASQGCTECNRDHEQLAEWLEELKIYKKALELAHEGSRDYYYNCITPYDEMNYYLDKARGVKNIADYRLDKSKEAKRNVDSNFLSCNL